MSLLAAASRPLYGAFRLARLNPDGLTYFDTTPAAFWFSFFAAVITFPVYVLIIITAWVDAGIDVAVWRVIPVELISYVIAWTAFPVILPLVLRVIDRQQHYIRAVITYNWASVIQNMVYLPVVLFGLMGGDSGPIGLMVLIVILFYSWYVIKVALDIRPIVAWGIIMLDVLISLVLNAWSDKLIIGS